MTVLPFPARPIARATEPRPQWRDERLPVWAAALILFWGSLAFWGAIVLASWALVAVFR